LPSRVHPEGKLVNKSQLVDALAARYEGNRKQAAHALESVLDTITREVAKGEKVAITGFGSFEKRVREARWVRNPRTGERIKAKKTAVPKFNAGADLKAVVSGAKKLPKLTLDGGRRARCRRRRPRRRPPPRSRRRRRPGEGGCEEVRCHEVDGQEGVHHQEDGREEGTGSQEDRDQDREQDGQEGTRGQEERDQDREQDRGQEGARHEVGGEEGPGQDGGQEVDGEEDRQEVLTN
jgi:DNA-binding protein HU-beta